MNFLFASVRKDLKRWSRDRIAVALWLGLPFLIGGLITSMMDSGGPAPTATLLITDEDDSLVSGLVVGAYGQEEMAEFFVVEQVSAEEGERRINDGEASGHLIIPEGFQDALLDETPVTLKLKTNPAQTILPGIIEDVTEILLDAGFYLQRFMGEELKAIKDAIEGDDGPSDVFTAGISVDIQNKFEAVGNKLDPLIIEVEIVEPPPEEPQPDFALLFLPGFVLMAMLFAANSMAADYWVERDKGTLRRLASAPGAWTGFLAGKAVAAFTMMCVVSSIVLVVGFAYHGIAWSKFVGSVLWVSLGGVCLFAWFGVIQMLFPNSRAANLMTMVLLFPLMMVGGSFFPFEALPDWVAAMGRFAPNGYVVASLSGEFTSATAWSIELRNWLTLLGAAVAGLAVSALRLRSGFARG